MPDSIPLSQSANMPAAAPVQGKAKKIILGFLLAAAYPTILTIIYVLLLSPIAHVSNFLVGTNPALTPSNTFVMSIVLMLIGITPFAGIAFVLLGFWFFPYFLTRPVPLRRRMWYVAAYAFTPFAFMIVFSLLASVIYLE